MYCRNCGKEVDDKAAVCIHCGVATHDQPAFQQPQYQQPVINVVNTNTNVNSNSDGTYVHKKKWAAFWLCLLLGGIGAHRFYVGKIGTGILYIFTGGGFVVGMVIDLIMILCGGFRDKAGQVLV